MDESLGAQVETYLTHLDGLMRRGRKVRDELENGPTNPSTMAIARAWQQDCGVTINQLSGGSKAHWLARAFSEAFLIRSANGCAAERVAPAQIITRLLDVLDQAAQTLSGMDGGLGGTEGSPSLSSRSSAAPPPRRFQFVHNPELRPVVEQAYLDSRRALEQGDYDLALRTSCGILEAIVTDALEHRGLSALTRSGTPAGKIGDWSFETRLLVAESAGLIRGGCARLPAIARTYRDHGDDDGEGNRNVRVAEGDARQTGQVLHVVMRDLDPGR
jgi:hypothetical protein